MGKGPLLLIVTVYPSATQLPSVWVYQATYLISSFQTNWVPVLIFYTFNTWSVYYVRCIDWNLMYSTWFDSHRIWMTYWQSWEMNICTAFTVGARYNHISIMILKSVQMHFFPTLSLKYKFCIPLRSSSMNLWRSWQIVALDCMKKTIDSSLTLRKYTDTFKK